MDIAASQSDRFSKKTGVQCARDWTQQLLFLYPKRPRGKLALENERLKKEIILIYHKHDGIYGAPKFRQELLKSELPFKVCEKRVQRIMKRLGLRSVVIKKFRPEKKDAVYNGGENLLNRDFFTTRRNEKWVSDVTYVHTLELGWCYLASIMDLSTSKIIGWCFSKTMDKSIVLSALDMAVNAENPVKGLILHSDRGSQYTCREYRDKLKALGIRQSFSAKGCPYDSAPIESFHSVLKKEMVYSDSSGCNPQIGFVYLEPSFYFIALG
ncbi:IS3 family transposase [Paenibacillus sp. YYML68]|uniref:IS3 family transposase n=1 Tax=Paenibacillus sp. YYML68 TaxID=2909250 RepID=UPI00248FC15B|nr:IS3 family transposase [Paenibacillus sp. YYML68]